VYQETTASGQKSNFNKIVKRETVMARAGAKRSRARKTGARGKNEKRGAHATGGAKKAAGGKRAAGAGKSSTGAQEYQGTEDRRTKIEWRQNDESKSEKTGRSSR
jgi:hypothetical protein